MFFFYILKMLALQIIRLYGDETDEYVLYVRI